VIGMGLPRLVTVLRGAGQAWIEKNALLYDTFTTDDAAPITSPRTCEPGPGTLTFVQTDGTQILSGGDFVFTAQTTPVWGDQGFYGTAQTRAAGLALLCPLTLSTWEECGVGWHTAAAIVDPDSMEHAIQANTTNGQFDTEAPVLAIASGLSAAIEYKVLQVLRDNGCFYVIDGKLYWESDSGNTATLYPEFSNLDGAGSMPDVDVLPLATYNSAWGGDWTEVTDTKTNPADGAPITMDADFSSRTTFTYEAGKSVSFFFRIGSGGRSQDSLYWTASTSGNLILYKWVGGSRSQIGIVASQFSDGVSYQVDCVGDGSSIKVFLDDVLKIGVTETDNQTNTYGGEIDHSLDTNDIEITTHPHPALGIATSRVVAPQEGDTGTHAVDFIAEMKNVTIPSVNQDAYVFRVSGSVELRLQFGSNGYLQFRDDGDLLIDGAAGSVSDGDDVVFVVDGSSAELFVNGSSIGATSSITNALNGTTFEALSTNDGLVCDHIACFPRDVSSLLPKGTF
jgi:hypothetical protein